MKSTMTKNEMVETVEELEAAQLDLDLVVDRIRRAVEGSPVNGTASAYTLPALMMISHEEGHGYVGKETGNLDAIIEDLEEEILEMDVEEVEEEDQDPEVRRGREKGIKEGEAGEEGPDPTDVNPSRQVKIHNQPDRVRDVLTALTDEELGMLRVACRSFDGHPGVDSKTIIFYKPEFLATALLGSVEDHARLQPRLLSGDDEVRGSKGMTAKGLSVAFEILTKFRRGGFPGVEIEDLAHVEMERDDEAGREAYLADLKVIEGGVS